jgi:hypothetical protein
MKDTKNILYKTDYVISAKTDIKKTFNKIRKQMEKESTKISTIEKTQSTNVVQYKKFK